MTNDILKFELPKDQSSIIKVFGVGGGGCNAVKHMYELGIRGVDFIVCNTDAQSLEINPVPNKIQIGKKGLGAGSIPTVGKEAAIEDLEKLRAALENNTEMVFITAGMGGGTGTGAAPVLAELAREMGILTVGIVTLPFGFEGRKRRSYAEEGINELKDHVDALLIICNDKLRELYGNLKMTEAFDKADNILTTAAKSIAEIITCIGGINVDLEDVKTVMRSSGVAIMGSGKSEGEGRARKAVEEALTSPLLNDSNIRGAKDILLYLAYGNEELTMDEVTEITEYVVDEAGQDVNVIWGYGVDPSLESGISVTLIATGFQASNNPNYSSTSASKTTIRSLEMPKPEAQNVVKQVSNLTDFKVDQKNSEIEASINQEQPLALKPEHIVHFLSDDDAPSNSNSQENNLAPTLKVVANQNSQNDAFRDEAQIVSPQYNPIHETEFDSEEFDEKDAERRSKLRSFNLNNTIKTEQGLIGIEKIPAYQRKGIAINDNYVSSDVQSSSLLIATNDQNQVEIKRKNPYLFDNVD
jgi:cell division protein FtsZ